MNEDEKFEKAARQVGKSDEPTNVATGEMLGGVPDETRRILGLMRGEIPEEEQRQRSEHPTHTPDDQEPRVSPEEGGKTIEQLLDEMDVAEDPSTMEMEEAESDDSTYVDIGGTRVPISTVEDWKDSWENSQQIVERQQELESQLTKDRGMWQQSLQALTDDPVEGLRALGLSDQQIKAKLQAAGLAPARADESADEWADLEADEDLTPAMRKLIKQNQHLAQQIESSTARQRQLMEGLERERLTKREQEMLDWHNGRVSKARDYLEGIVKKSSNLDGATRSLLLKATMADVEGGIDRAPLDEPGLREWAKVRLKEQLSDIPSEDLARVAKNPRRTRELNRPGETPRAPKGSEFEKVSFHDDDDRKRGALAWLDHHARSG